MQHYLRGHPGLRSRCIPGRPRRQAPAAPGRSRLQLYTHPGVVLASVTIVEHSGFCQSQGLADSRDLERDRLKEMASSENKARQKQSCKHKTPFSWGWVRPRSHDRSFPSFSTHEVLNRLSIGPQIYLNLLFLASFCVFRSFFCDWLAVMGSIGLCFRPMCFNFFPVGCSPHFFTSFSLFASWPINVARRETPDILRSTKSGSRSDFRPRFTVVRAVRIQAAEASEVVHVVTPSVRSSTVIASCVIPTH